MENTNTFKVGLCMAGAISAGAYTAGVIDYLLEALEEWQKRKDAGQANVPSHNVEIPVIGGASAGGMTGIVTSSALYDHITPVKTAPQNILEEIKTNKFYHSWVDLVAENMMDVMLNTSDISKTGVESCLNAEFIDKIADRAVSVNGNQPVERKYIAKHLKVFVTLSNLNGIDYSVTFRSNTPQLDKYIITSHNDYVCFMIADDESQYNDDGWIPLNFSKKINADLAKDAAMATGAFPIGLKARKVKRKGKYLNDLDWLKHITRDAQQPFPDAEYPTINIDGGMINNEPFDQLRNVLGAETKQLEPTEYQNFNTFKSTILMIDPFPSQSEDFKGNTGLMSVVGNTLGALIDQSRVKPSTLISAMDSNNAGQFLIAPVRYEKSKSIEGSLAIACGSLNGFGGFISKEFRIHDYFLGRSNCEKFLRDHFTVPINTTNPIFVNGYANIADKSNYISTTDGGLQIIPIFTPRQEPPYMPTFSNGKQYPSVSENFISSYKGKLKTRVEKILLNITKYNQAQKALIWIGAKVMLNGKIANAVIDTILESLEKHRLLNK